MKKHTFLLLQWMILYLLHPTGIFAQYELSICAIFKDEAPFLKEWIEFHKLQGIEHFFLYNNNSKDDFEKVLMPYVVSNEVTLIDWPFSYELGDSEKWLSIQCSAYMDCITKYGETTAWLAVIDTNEFLFCPDGERIPSFLVNYEDFGGVCVNWRLFGTSYVEDIPPGALMIEVLTKCSLVDNFRNRRIKSIVQPKWVKGCPTAHSFTYAQGYHAVDADRKRIEGGESPFISLDKIRINHYWTRTEKHFREKKMQSRLNRRTWENYLQEWADSYNLTEDTAILQFVPALHERMAQH